VSGVRCGALESLEGYIVWELFGIKTKIPANITSHAH